MHWSRPDLTNSDPRELFFKQPTELSADSNLFRRKPGRRSRYAPDPLKSLDFYNGTAFLNSRVSKFTKTFWNPNELLLCSMSAALIPNSVEQDVSTDRLI